MVKTSNLFNPNSLNMILDDAQDVHKVEEIALKLKDDDEMIQQNSKVDVKRVYGELASLIEIGNDVLKSAKYAIDIDPTAEGVLAGASSVIHAVNDTVKEFTKIHIQNLKFEQQKQIEYIKQKGREKLVLLRQPTDEEKDIETVPYNQEEIIKQLNEMEKVNDKEDE